MLCCASGGNSWSKATISSINFNSTINIAAQNFNYGLSSFTFTMGTHEENYVYAAEVSRLAPIWDIPDPSKAPPASANSSPKLLLDYKDAQSGGGTSGAFIAFGIIFTMVSMFFHLCLWPLNKYPAIAHRFLLPTTIALTVCLLFSFLFWNAMGHSAAQRITLDKYAAAFPVIGQKNVNLPSVERGWCYDVVVVSCVFSILAGIPSYFAQKLSLERPEVFNAVTGSDESNWSNEQKAYADYADM